MDEKLSQFKKFLASAKARMSVLIKRQNDVLIEFHDEMEKKEIEKIRRQITRQ